MISSSLVLLLLLLVGVLILFDCVVPSCANFEKLLGKSCRMQTGCSRNRVISAASIFVPTTAGPPVLLDSSAADDTVTEGKTLLDLLLLVLPPAPVLDLQITTCITVPLPPSPTVYSSTGNKHKVAFVYYWKITF